MFYFILDIFGKSGIPKLGYVPSFGRILLARNTPLPAHTSRYLVTWKGRIPLFGRA